MTWYLRYIFLQRIRVTICTIIIQFFWEATVPLPLPTTYYLLPTTYYLLPTAYYLLPTTYYLLPTTYYLCIPILSSCGNDWLLITSKAHFAASICWTDWKKDKFQSINQRNFNKKVNPFVNIPKGIESLPQTLIF